MSRKKKIYIRILLFLLLAPSICIAYAWYEARNIRVNEMTFSHDDIPISFVGKKIIFISDLHCDKYFTPEHTAKLVEKINKRNPDIILLGGDYTSRNSIRYADSFFKEMVKLKSKYGVYSVLGNHDHWENATLIQQGFKDCGFNICDNQSYWVKEGNDSIKIGGVGDFWVDEQFLEKTVDDVKRKDFCILLSHNPDYMEVLETDRVDLMLSGHTHAGQITFLGLWAPIMPSTYHPEFLQTGLKYRHGWVEKNDIKLYVTSGIGMGGFPFRFFAQPEIVEITLKK